MLVLGSNDMVPCTLLTLFPNRKSLFYILVFLLFDTAWHILSCVHKMSFIPPLCVYHALTLRPQQLNFSPHALDVLWFPAVVFPLTAGVSPLSPVFIYPHTHLVVDWPPSNPSLRIVCWPAKPTFPYISLFQAPSSQLCLGLWIIISTNFGLFRTAPSSIRASGGRTAKKHWLSTPCCRCPDYSLCLNSVVKASFAFGYS